MYGEYVNSSRRNHVIDDPIIASDVLSDLRMPKLRNHSATVREGFQHLYFIKDSFDLKARSILGDVGSILDNLLHVAVRLFSPDY